MPALSAQSFLRREGVKGGRAGPQKRERTSRKGVLIFCRPGLGLRGQRAFWIVVGLAAFISSFFLEVDCCFPQWLPFPPALFPEHDGRPFGSTPSSPSPSDLLSFPGLGPSKALKILQENSKRRIVGNSPVRTSRQIFEPERGLPSTLLYAGSSLGDIKNDEKPGGRPITEEGEHLRESPSFLEFLPQRDGQEKKREGYDRR